jgi:hypothetical protein
VHSPGEIAAGRGGAGHAAVWVPLLTFMVTGVCCVVVALLVTSAAGPGHGWPAELLAGLAVLGVGMVGLEVLTWADDHFSSHRVGGRTVPADVADAYEAVRDAPAVLVRLGVPPAALETVADLLPRAERMLDLLGAHEARGGDVRRHQAHPALVRMGAEVTVLVEMARERMAQAGRGPGRSRDRGAERPRPEPAPAERALATLELINDLVQMLGPDVPGRSPRRRRGVS